MSDRFFPSNPGQGAVVTDRGWKWDGCRWVPFGGWRPECRPDCRPDCNPQTCGCGFNMGVTDGSDAKPGQIGEFYQTYNILSGFTPRLVAWSGNLVTMPLSAGDWDLTGSYAVQSPKARPDWANADPLADLIYYGFDVDYIGTTQPIDPSAGTWWEGNEYITTLRAASTMQRMRANLAAPAMVGINVLQFEWNMINNADPSSGAIVIWGVINVRRVR